MKQSFIILFKLNCTKRRSYSWSSLLFQKAYKALFKASRCPVTLQNLKIQLKKKDVNGKVKSNFQVKKGKVL